jgi:hypothetical protein
MKTLIIAVTLLAVTIGAGNCVGTAIKDAIETSQESPEVVADKL